MNATHEISPIRQRPFLAGFWLMAAIPAYIPILGLLMQVFNLEFESRLPASSFSCGILQQATCGHVHWDSVRVCLITS